MPIFRRTCTLREAHSIVWLDLQRLMAEVARVAKRGDARLNGMARVQVLRRSLDVMELIHLRSPPVSIREQPVAYDETVTGRTRGRSRSDRRDQIIVILEAMVRTAERSGYAGRPDVDEAIGHWKVAIEALSECTFPSIYHPTRQEEAAQ